VSTKGTKNTKIILHDKILEITRIGILIKKNSINRKHRRIIKKKKSIMRTKNKFLRSKN